jgi:hypothetical protein
MPTPVDAEHVEFNIAFTHPTRLSAQQHRMAKMAIASIVSQTEQDIPIWEHKMYLDNPVLCDGDGPIHHYRKWFQQFYSECGS